MEGNNNKSLQEAPKPKQKGVQESFDPTPLLSKIDRLEEGYKVLKETVAFVKDANWVLLAVLALGFIALMISFISGIIQATNSNTNAQIEFIRAVDKLTNTVNSIESTIKIKESTSSSNINSDSINE